MPDLSDFLPLTRETAATVRARMDADANAGLDPSDPRWIDTTQGGFYADMAQVMALEAERLWDMLGTEVAAAVFPAYAWGDYLDEHADTVGLTRKAAAFAEGLVTFSGTTGTLISTGTQVATQQPDAESEPVTFTTTESGTIGGSGTGTVTLAVRAVEAGALGNVSAASVTVLLSPAAGVTSVANSSAIAGGADVETDEALRSRVLLEYRATQGAGTASDYERWALEDSAVGFATCDPLWAGAGTVRVVITDPSNDPVSQPVIDRVQTMLDPPAAATTLNGGVTLPTATITLHSTAGLRNSGSEKVVIAGSQVVTYTGISGSNLTGCSGGSGAVADNSTVVQGGRGDGRAPIGAIVTVTTPATVTVPLAATVVYETGYSRDGTSGTIPLGTDIKAAITAYVNALKAGDDIIRSKVIAAIVDVRGVADVTACTINAVSANYAVAAAEIANAGTITLS